VTPASALSDPRVTSSDTGASGLRDAADAPVSEVVERFFRAIVAQVPPDRIEELHLFAPLRSGGVETGIAVIAARVEATVESSNRRIVESTVEEPVVDESTATVDESTATVDEQALGLADSPTPRFADSPTVDDSPISPDTLHEIVEDAIEESIDYVAEEPLPVERHTVYTARYRLVQKGPDRGKWEASVVDEADAPLITVEMVVRGVQRRAGEASDTTRYSGAQIARALRMPLKQPLQPPPAQP
jgi:hypothetical protein